MIENVVGVLGLPLGLALNFLINGRDYVVPLCVEEPSIVAGLVGRGAHRAAVRRLQVERDRSDPDRPGATGRHGRSAAGDGGTRKRTATRSSASRTACTRRWWRAAAARATSNCSTTPRPKTAGEMVVVHLLVDTRDAMGANLVNTMCEGVASLVESITGGKVFLRILSNLTDRALARAQMVIPVNNLEGKGYSGAEVRDGIILANDLATVDPYRAATHNKGIMNGVDAVALATGNDWRAHRSRRARLRGARRPLRVADALVQERARRPASANRDADESRHRRRIARNESRRCASITACSVRPTRANSPRSWPPSASRRTSRRCARCRPTASSKAT